MEQQFNALNKFADSTLHIVFLYSLYSVRCSVFFYLHDTGLVMPVDEHRKSSLDHNFQLRVSMFNIAHIIS